jgi:hypothetical protein
MYMMNMFEGVHSCVITTTTATTTTTKAETATFATCRLVSKLFHPKVGDPMNPFQVLSQRQFSSSSSTSSTSSSSSSTSSTTTTTPTTTPLVVVRPFRILGIQQIAVGGLEKQPMNALWIDILGLSLVSSFRSTTENVDEDVLSLGQGPHAVEVDLMTPLDPQQSPKVRIMRNRGVVIVVVIVIVVVVMVLSI